MKIKKTKSILLLVLIMTFSVFPATTAQASDVAEDPCHCTKYFTCSAECRDSFIDKGDCGLTCECHTPQLSSALPDEEITPMSIPCECGGSIVSVLVGTGTWQYIDTYICNDHSYCSIQKYVRNHYYEEYCTGTCRYFRESITKEYDYRHVS